MGAKFYGAAVMTAATVPAGTAQSSWPDRPQSVLLTAGEVAEQQGYTNRHYIKHEWCQCKTARLPPV
eukprot:549066-Amphidinium_carterae.1